jgi:hypothetical protein
MQAILLFLQQLQQAGVPFTILRAAGKRGVVIRITSALGTTIVRIKPSSILA